MTKRQKPSGSSAKKGSNYTVVGKLSDGVRVLAPKSKPKHFTSEQIQSAIRQARTAKTSRYAEAKTRRG